MLDEINGRYCWRKSSKLKNIAIEIIQNETQRKKTEKLNEQHMSELWEMLIGLAL